MRFESSDHHRLWAEFERDRQAAYRLRSEKAGDQRWITVQLKGDPSVCLWPNGWCWSYKQARKAVEAGAAWPAGGIAVFHGRPKPDQVDDSWVKEHRR